MFEYLVVLPNLRRSNGFSSSWSAVELGGSSHLQAQPTDPQTRSAEPHSALCWTRERRERCLSGTNPASLNHTIFLKELFSKNINFPHLRSISEVILVNVFNVSPKIFFSNQTCWCGLKESGRNLTECCNVIMAAIFKKAGISFLVRSNLAFGQGRKTYSNSSD